VPARVNADAAKFAVVGYLPDYRIASMTSAELGPVTDLVFFGLEPPADGRFPATPVDSAVLRKLHEIKRVAGCRLLICIGGWNRSEGFAALAENPVSRQRFISGLIEYCHNSEFDGVDYDWEHPKDADQIRNYARLLSDTRDAFHDQQLLVTIAQAVWQNLGEAAYEAVDRVHLMSYDHEFPQATFAKSKADVARLVGWRCPTAKIALGLPFYGRNGKNKARAYGELVGHNAHDPKVDSIDGFAFNGQATIIRKVQFATKHKLAGVMIWELGQDASAKDASLLTTIHSQLQSKANQDAGNKHNIKVQ
jgi:chitinase